MGSEDDWKVPRRPRDPSPRISAGFSKKRRADEAERVAEGCPEGLGSRHPAPRIRPWICPIRPKRARFVPTHARFVTFWILWIDGFFLPRKNPAAWWCACTVIHTHTHGDSLMKKPMVSFARLSRVVFMVGVAALFGSLPLAAHAITIDWVTVGDPGNTADTTGDPNPAGAVADAFQIMKFEFTNQQYTAFLNSVAATDTYSLYNTNMGSNARGGITRSGASGSYTYATRTNMGDKPVNYVSWFDAARVSNWLMNGGTSSSSTETGAYTLTGGQTSGNAPAVNPGATFYVPLEDQWYKAAYYKGGSTNAGYWNYATQSDSAPTAVTAGSTGIGSAGNAGNFANFIEAADWNSRNGNVTTVGTNGGASAYGAFDMSGNILEWNDLTGSSGSSRGLRGGDWYDFAFSLSSSNRTTDDPVDGNDGIGFRLASPVPVPEPSTWVMGLAGIACGGWQMVRRRRAR